MATYDPEAMLATLNRIFPQHRRALMFAALRIVRDRELAEDLAQEAYLRALETARTTPIEHVEAFLYKTVRNLALDCLRRRRTRERHEEPDIGENRLHDIPADIPSIEMAMIEREQVRLLDEALQSLPERARRCWALSQVHGWSYARIADHLGVSRNTVYNDMKLVMGHLSDVLRRYL